MIEEVEYADAVAIGTAFTRFTLPVNPGLAELLAENQLATLISWMTQVLLHISERGILPL
jgi:hypothetical protein